MAETVKWVLELQDRVSPSGQKILRSLAGIQKVVGQFGGKGIKLASAGVKKLASSVGSAIPNLVKWGALGAVAAGSGLAYAGVRLAADAQAFKDRTGIALRSLLKSESAAGGAYKRMLDFAHYFGQDPSDALERFNGLLSGGFSAGDAEKLMQSFGDLKIVSPNVNFDSLASAFSEIRKKGRLELGDFESAVNAGGLNVTLAYEKIGKKIGRSAEQVKAMMAAGRFNAKDGILGLIDAINEKTNSKKAGERLEEYSKTTTGMLDKLKGLPGQFIDRITADDSPIKGTLSKLLEQLDPNSPNGMKILAALNGVVAKVGGVLQSWATPEGIEKLSKGFTQVIEAAPKILKAIGAISSGVLVVVDSFSSFRDNCRFLWAEISRGGVIATAFGAVIVGLAAPIAGIGIAIYGGAKAVISGVKTIWAWLSDLSTKAITWGTDIVGGLWKGLKDAWAGLLKSIKSLFDALPLAARKALEIASPSRKFAKIGVQTMAGYAQGVDTGAPAAKDSVVTAIEGGRSAAMTSSVTNVGGARSSTNNTRGGVSISNTFHVDSDGGAVDYVKLGRFVDRKIVAAFELASLEWG